MTCQFTESIDTCHNNLLVNTDIGIATCKTTSRYIRDYFFISCHSLNSNDLLKL